MRVAVMGSGGIGGVLGGRLQATGQDVRFIARGSHLAALQGEGLRLLSPNGDLHLPSVQVTDDPASIGACDVVVFAVKMPDAAAAAKSITPLVGPDTLVAPYLNGVEATDILIDAVGRAPVVGGVAYISAAIDRPGVIRQTGTFQRFVHGELDGSQSDRLAAWHQALSAAGIESQVTDAIEREVWRKFILLAAHSGVTSLTRRPIGDVRDHPDTMTLAGSAVAETAAVAAARGVGLPNDVVAQTMATIEGMPADMKSSMLVDLERGKPLELAWLSGAVARLGQAHNVPTPSHQFIATALALHADGQET